MSGNGLDQPRQGPGLAVRIRAAIGIDVLAQQHDLARAARGTATAPRR